VCLWSVAPVHCMLRMFAVNATTRLIASKCESGEFLLLVKFLDHMLLQNLFLFTFTHEWHETHILCQICDIILSVPLQGGAKPAFCRYQILLLFILSSRLERFIQLNSKAAQKFDVYTTKLR